MQYIFGGAAASCSTVPKAVAPFVTDVTLAIAQGAGNTAAELFGDQVGDGTQPAPYGGFVYKNLTCDAVKLVVSYLVGDDCNPCTVDTLTKQDVTITIPADASGIALPPGYIGKITAQVVDSAGVAKVSSAGGSLQFTSSRPLNSCGGNVFMPAIA